MNFDKVGIRLPNGQPKVNQNTSYHLENKKFVDFLERKADDLGIAKIDDVVNQVETGDAGVQRLFLEGGQEVEADFFVDASGYRAELIGKALGEDFMDFTNALFCDRAIVGGWKRTTEPYHPFTTAETMDAGWSWQIEHDDLINRGYVFCSKNLTDEQAIDEFRQKNPKLEIAKAIPFPAGVHRRTWVKNVIAIGNSAGFVEPLEATAIGMICDAAVRLVKALQASGNRNLPIQQKIYNRITQTNWETIRDFLALHYKFNTRLDTEFWKTARAEVDIGEAQEFVDYYRHVGPDFSMLDSEFRRNSFTAEGYMVMLLGQQVPFENTRNVSLNQQQAWLRIKHNLKNLAQGGLSVEDYLKWMRASESRPEIARQTGMAIQEERRHARVGDNMKSGELNWL
jgi:tryptophan halogenase